MRRPHRRMTDRHGTVLVLFRGFPCSDLEDWSPQVSGSTSPSMLCPMSRQFVTPLVSSMPNRENIW